MADFFGAGMRLYLDKMIDWESLLTLRSGEDVDVEAEVGAFRPMYTRRGNADYCALDPQVRELVEETLRGGARGGDTQ